MWSRLWQRITGKVSAKTAEVQAILDFLHDGPANVKKLTDSLNARTTPFTSVASYVFLGPGGLIRVEDDCYGYEVKVGHHLQMLDCNPHVYGLTREEAQPLFDAILSNVPGSVPFEEKMLRNRKATPCTS